MTTANVDLGLESAKAGTLSEAEVILKEDDLHCTNDRRSESQFSQSLGTLRDAKAGGEDKGAQQPQRSSDPSGANVQTAETQEHSKVGAGCWSLCPSSDCGHRSRACLELLSRALLRLFGSTSMRGCWSCRSPKIPDLHQREAALLPGTLTEEGTDWFD